MRTYKKLTSNQEVSKLKLHFPSEYALVLTPKKFVFRKKKFETIITPPFSKLCKYSPHEPPTRSFKASIWLLFLTEQWTRESFKICLSCVFSSLETGTKIAPPKKKVIWTGLLTSFRNFVVNSKLKSCFALWEKEINVFHRSSFSF